MTRFIKQKHGPFIKTISLISVFFFFVEHHKNTQSANISCGKAVASAKPVGTMLTFNEQSGRRSSEKLVWMLGLIISISPFTPASKH